MCVVGRLLQPALCLLLVFALGACSPGVTLTLRDGTTVSGRPLANDATSVEVQTSHGRYRVCKRDVADADHAGNGAVYAGLLLAAAGTAFAYASARSAHPSSGWGDASGFVTLGVTTAAAGVAIGFGGLGQFIASKNATGLPPSGNRPPKDCKQPDWYVGQ